MFERQVEGFVVKNESGKYLSRTFRTGDGDRPHFVLNMVDCISQATLFETPAAFLKPDHPYRNIGADIIIQKAKFVRVVRRESYFEGTEVEILNEECNVCGSSRE